MATTLEVLIRGREIPAGASAIVELEQGATRLPENQEMYGPLGANDVAYHWFRFRLPSLD
jgi:hypothetical protein